MERHIKQVRLVISSSACDFSLVAAIRLVANHSSSRPFSRMAGDAIDWSYASAGIEWSYSAELRDTGTVSVHTAWSCNRHTYVVSECSMDSCCLEVLFDRPPKR